jgi:hypothetical protein
MMVALTWHGSEESPGLLAQALAPPLNEMPEQRALRETKEVKVRHVSEQIDEQIRLEKQANTRKKILVKVLMLREWCVCPLKLPSQLTHSV